MLGRTTALATALFMAASAAPVQADEPVGFLDLEDLTVAILDAIKETRAENQDEEPYFLITGIRLDLKGTEDDVVQGGLKIPIFEAAASAEGIAQYTNSHALTLDLAPDTPIATRAVPDIRLSEMVRAVKTAFHGDGEEEALPPGDAPEPEEAEDPESTAVTTEEEEGEEGDAVAEASGAEDPDPLPFDDIRLNPDRLSYTYSGVLKKKAGGGLDFAFVKIGGSLERRSLQVITFDLCRTINKVNCVE
jgi:hypothetical protein